MENLRTTHYLNSTFWIHFLVGFIFLTGICQADQLFLKSGATVQGEMISFDGRVYQFFLQNERVNYDLEEIRGFSIQREKNSANIVDMQQVMLRLGRIEYKIENLAKNYQESSQSIQQKIFDLNPVSQISVQSQETRKQRDGRLRVWGRLINTSNEVVYNLQVRAELYNARGELIDTKDFTPNSRNIGPGGSINYDVKFDKVPNEIGEVILTPYTRRREFRRGDIGDYGQSVPSKNRYNRY